MTNNLEIVLQSYDVKGKKFSFIDFSSELDKIRKAGICSIELFAESLAARFVASGKFEEWGTFYGPMLTFKDKDTGAPIYSPDISEITEDIIRYWKDRASVAINPLLKARYSGLVWEFCKRVTGEYPSYKDIMLAHVSSCIEAVEGDYAMHPTEGLVYARRAIDTAVSIGAKDLADRAISAIISYIDKYAEDTTPGIWGVSFVLMLNHLTWFKKVENDVVKSHDNRFSRLEKLVNNEIDADIYFNCMKDEGELLSKYYIIKKESDQAKSYLDRVVTAIRSLYATKGGMWSQVMMMNMQSLYRQFNFDAEANKIYIDIQRLGAYTIKEMRTISVPITLKNSDIDNFANRIVSDDKNKTLTNYIAANLIKISTEQELQSIQEKGSVLDSLVPTIMYNYAGIPLKILGVGDDNAGAKLIYGIYHRMLLYSYCMRLEINKMKDLGIYTIDTILEKFKDNPLIENCKRPLFERGLRAYFDDDYIVACSLLVPQFESAIRNLAAITGHDVLRTAQNPKDGNEYKSLDSLLDMLYDINNSDDIIKYFKILFTDKNGWNLRNLICHGLLPVDQFGQRAADRIVHAFLVLSKLEFKPYG